MAPVPTIRLEAAGLAPLDLTCGDISAVRLDLGDAMVRESFEDAPDTDGTIDTTQLTGSRIVTLEVLIDSNRSGQSRWALTQRLRAFTHAWLRPQLFVKFSPDDPELVLTMRRYNFFDIVGPADNGFGRVTVQWVVPYGLIESAELHTATVTASGTGSFGITFPVIFPLSFGEATPEGSTLITNAGNVHVYPVLRLHGPFSGLTSVFNDLTGQAIVLDGETVAEGDYLEIDVRNRTVKLNGTDERGHRVVYPSTSWWVLAPGSQRVRFVPSVFTTPAQTIIEWRDGYA